MSRDICLRCPDTSQDARGGIRTHIPCCGPSILSRLRIPIPPPGPASGVYGSDPPPDLGSLGPKNRNFAGLTGYLGLLATIEHKVEASALTHTTRLPGLRGPTALLRLQSDEQLIPLTDRKS